MGARARSISYVTSWGHVIPRLSKLKRKENKPRDFVSPILPITMALAALGMVNVGGGGSPQAPLLFQENPRKLNLSLAFQVVLKVYLSI